MDAEKLAHAIVQKSFQEVRTYAEQAQQHLKRQTMQLQEVL